MVCGASRRDQCDYVPPLENSSHAFTPRRIYILSSVLLVSGLLAVTLAVVSLATKAWGYYYGNGFWGGTVFISAGAVGFHSVRSMSRTSITVFMALSGISIMFSLVMMALSSIAITSDNILFQESPSSEGKSIITPLLNITVAVFGGSAGIASTIFASKSVCGSLYNPDLTYGYPSMMAGPESFDIRGQQPQGYGEQINARSSLHQTPQTKIQVTITSQIDCNQHPNAMLNTAGQAPMRPAVSQHPMNVNNHHQVQSSLVSSHILYSHQGNKYANNPPKTPISAHSIQQHHVPPQAIHQQRVDSDQPYQTSSRTIPKPTPHAERIKPVQPLHIIPHADQQRPLVLNTNEQLEQQRPLPIIPENYVNTLSETSSDLSFMSFPADGPLGYSTPRVPSPIEYPAIDQFCPDLNIPSLHVQQDHRIKDVRDVIPTGTPPPSYDDGAAQNVKQKPVGKDDNLSRAEGMHNPMVPSCTSFQDNSVRPKQYSRGIQRTRCVMMPDGTNVPTVEDSDSLEDSTLDDDVEGYSSVGIGGQDSSAYMAASESSNVTISALDGHDSNIGACGFDVELVAYDASLKKRTPNSKTNISGVLAPLAPSMTLNPNEESSKKRSRYREIPQTTAL